VLTFLYRDIVDVKHALGNVYSIFMDPITDGNDRLGESNGEGVSVVQVL
jgi:hypothetical protein